MGRISPETYTQVPKVDLVIALDNIRSGNNVGSVFRTSDAFRIREVLLGGISAQPPHRDIQKTALGADKTVNWRYAHELIDLLEEYKSKRVEKLPLLSKWKNVLCCKTGRLIKINGSL